MPAHAAAWFGPSGADRFAMHHDQLHRVAAAPVVGLQPVRDPLARQRRRAGPAAEVDRVHPLPGPRPGQFELQVLLTERPPAHDSAITFHLMTSAGI